MRTFLLSAAILFTGIVVQGQSPTTVTPATNCVVYHNFNSSGEGFSSPSIYAGQDDVEFNWNSTMGVELETSGLMARSGSLISPVYLQTIAGSTTIGFRYVAPAGTEYRIRIISAQASPPLEILATTASGPVYTPLSATSGNICILLTDADLVPGRLIRIEFTFRMILAGDVLFDDLAQSVQASPLPVTFEGFVARKNTDGSIKLLWNVGEESNVKGYYVETSTNGVNFTSVGFVTAAGKSIYSFNNPGILKQTTFFRIRNLDFDGASKYSIVIRMYAGENADPAIRIYPVPANEQVTIQHNPSAMPSMITLIGMDGRIVRQVYSVPYTYQTQLNIHTLAKGLYLVRFDDGQANIQIGKLIKN
jgi:Secretion system C-terminal sorting domain